MEIKKFKLKYNHHKNLFSFRNFNTTLKLKTLTTFQIPLRTLEIETEPALTKSINVRSKTSLARGLQNLKNNSNISILKFMCRKCYQTNN